MGDFGVLGDGQHVVAGAGDRVSHQENAVPLPLEQGDGFLAAQPSPVPARAVFGVKIAGHGCGISSEAWGLSPSPLPIRDSYTNFGWLNVSRENQEKNKKKRYNKAQFSETSTSNYSRGVLKWTGFLFAPQKPKTRTLTRWDDWRMNSKLMCNKKLRDWNGGSGEKLTSSTGRDAWSMGSVAFTCLKRKNVDAVQRLRIF